MAFNCLKIDLVDIFYGLDNSIYFKNVLEHFSEITPFGVHLTKCQPDPTSHLTECQTGP